VEVAPTTLDFGARQVGRSGPPRTVRMSNVGTGPLEVRSVQPAGAEGGEFSVSSETCTRFLLTPGGSCEVVVDFTPRARGARSGRLVFADDAAGNPHEVALGGIGMEAPRPDPLPRVDIAPSPLDFGRQDVGRPAVRQRVQVRNVGAGALVVRSVRPGGGEAEDFAVTGESCTQNAVLPGAACAVVVEFTPRGPGTRSADLLITDNAAGSVHHVPLRGVGERGRPAPVPLVEIAPNPVDFGRQEVGRAAERQIVRLTNVGSGALLVRSVRPRGGEVGEFDVQSETCTQGAIAPGAGCTIAVGFTPRARGDRVGGLLFDSNASGSPHLVELRGVGNARPGGTPAPLVEISPTRMDFGQRGKTPTANRQTVRVRNVGTGPLEVHGIAITGGDGGDFAVRDQTCTRGPVAPGAICEIPVEFIPKTAGSRAAQLVVTDNAPGSPRRVSLAGTVAPPRPTPAAKIAPSALRFGSAVVGRTGTPGNVQVMSVGTSALKIAGVQLGGANVADFTIASETCTASPVRPDTSCTIVVSFTPRSAGRRTGILAIRDDAVDGPHQIALSGEGMAPTIPRGGDTPRRVLDFSQIEATGWCCAGGAVTPSSRQACALKNGAYQSTEDAARRQCAQVIR